MTADALFDNLRQSMVLGRSHGLDYEAQRFLPKGWRVEFLPDGYNFHATWSEDWENGVWSLVRLLTYQPLTAVRRSTMAGVIQFDVVSSMEDGTGFRAVFRADGAPSA